MIFIQGQQQNVNKKSTLLLITLLIFSFIVQIDTIKFKSQVLDADKQNDQIENLQKDKKSIPQSPKEDSPIQIKPQQAKQSLKQSQTKEKQKIQTTQKVKIGQADNIIPKTQQSSKKFNSDINSLFQTQSLPKEKEKENVKQIIPQKSSISVAQKKQTDTQSPSSAPVSTAVTTGVKTQSTHQKKQDQLIGGIFGDSKAESQKKYVNSAQRIQAQKSQPQQNPQNAHKAQSSNQKVTTVKQASTVNPAQLFDSSKNLVQSSNLKKIGDTSQTGIVDVPNKESNDKKSYIPVIQDRQKLQKGKDQTKVQSPEEQSSQVYYSSKREGAKKSLQDKTLKKQSQTKSLKESEAQSNTQSEEKTEEKPAQKIQISKGTNNEESQEAKTQTQSSQKKNSDAENQPKKHKQQKQSGYIQRQQPSQQSSQVAQSKKSHKFNRKKNKQQAPNTSKAKQQAKSSLTLIITFCLYSFIIVMVLVVIKCTSTQSKAAQSVNILLDAISDVFKKKQGYRPALNEEEVIDKQQQVTMGYKLEDNKEIFWEKNSVQGI